MQTQPNPPAVVRAATTAADKVAECRTLSAHVLLRNSENVADIRAMGRLLCEAKAEVGHGNWLEFLKEKWPDLPERTAQAWMRVHKSAGVADLNARLRAATHPADDAGADVDPDDPPADMGDAYEGEEMARPAPAPKLRREPQKPRQAALDMDPELTRAKALVAEARDSGEAFIDYVQQVLDSRAGNELRKHARLASWEFAPNRWPPANLIRQWLDKISRQGFE